MAARTHHQTVTPECTHTPANDDVTSSPFTVHAPATASKFCCAFAMLTVNVILCPIPTSPEFGVTLTTDATGTFADGDRVRLAVGDGEGDGGGGENSRDADTDGDDVSEGDCKAEVFIKAAHKGTGH